MSFLDDWRIERDTRLAHTGARTTKEESNESEEAQREPDPPRNAAKRSAYNTDEERRQRRIYDGTYRNTNKAEINQRRRREEAEPVGAFKKARRRAWYKKQPWSLSFENWFQVWQACPKIFDDATGTYRHAWQMRSGDIQNGTQMRRLDINKGWQVNNVAIYYRNQPIPEHGIVAPWDYTRNRPSLPEEVGAK